jgi:hypothetical protein
VVREEGWGNPLPYELCERREGHRPLDGVVLDGGPQDEKELARIARDPADTLLASGKLPSGPLELRVLDAEPALVMFENYRRG